LFLGDIERADRTSNAAFGKRRISRPLLNVRAVIPSRLPVK
jgi:hypothetical protein